MTSLEWHFQWKVASLYLQKNNEYCLTLNSDYKFGENIEQTKLPVRNSYNKPSDYILNKPKTDLVCSNY